MVHYRVAKPTIKNENLTKDEIRLCELELKRGYEELGKAQLENPTMYPADNLDGFDFD